MSKLQAPAVRFTPVQIAVWLAGFILLTGNATLIILDRTHSLHIDGLQALRHLALPLGLLCFGGLAPAGSAPSNSGPRDLELPPAATTRGSSRSWGKPGCSVASALNAVSPGAARSPLGASAPWWRRRAA